MKSGAGEEDAFKPIWQFYDAMEVFLRDVYECKSICNSENTQDEEDIDTVELDDGESGSITKMQTTDAQNSASQASSDNSNLETQTIRPETNSKALPKRRAKNPPELQDASKQMSVAFNTLNSVLQNKKNKEDKENDAADLFCKLLAKQLKDFPQEEKEEIMYEIHGLILNKRRRRRSQVLQPSISPSFYNRSPSAQNSTYLNESSPRNIISLDPLIVQQSLHSDSSASQIIINRPSSSRSSYTTPTPQPKFNENLNQMSRVDQQPTQYRYTSPSPMLINRPSSSRSSMLPQNFNQEISRESPAKIHILSQEIFNQPDTNILLEAFEKAMSENEKVMTEKE